MHEFHPYFTNDGSVGLYNKGVDDIYHSSYGALTEAYEKFILPANFERHFANNDEIRILDLCFGIGYNTKSFLNYYFENFEKFYDKKKMYIGKIDTDNIVNDKNSNLNTKKSKKRVQYHEKIDTDNILLKFFDNLLPEYKKNKILIDVIDNDKNLIYLAPFFKTGVRNPKNDSVPFNQEKITKILNKKGRAKYKLKKETNIILLRKLFKSINDEDFYYFIKDVLNDKNYNRYFDKYMTGLFKYYGKKGYYDTSVSKLKHFLHNIYYRYISKSYKNASKLLKFNEIILHILVSDAREALLSTDSTYDFIFLDAFSPAKCPCLWTLDFFKLLHDHLSPDGIILTYSNAVNVRHAFIEANLYVGKIIDPTTGKNIGTIASKNLKLIENGLTEYDLGLIKTRAGIIYRDEKLTLDNKSIIANHSEEVANSELMSSSKYIKLHAKNAGVKDDL